MRIAADIVESAEQRIVELLLVIQCGMRKNPAAPVILAPGNPDIPAVHIPVLGKPDSVHNFARSFVVARILAVAVDRVAAEACDTKKRGDHTLSADMAAVAALVDIQLVELVGTGTLVTVVRCNLDSGRSLGRSRMRPSLQCPLVVLGTVELGSQLVTEAQAGTLVLAMMESLRLEPVTLALAGKFAALMALGSLAFEEEHGTQQQLAAGTGVVEVV